MAVGPPTATEPPRADQVVATFQEAFAAHDLDTVMALMTEDCSFEDASPPDGIRHQGQEAVRAAFGQLFRDSPHARFHTEERFACGDRVVVRWRYSWAAGHVRGVDVFQVRASQVVEKVSYVKG